MIGVLWPGGGVVEVWFRCSSGMVVAAIGGEVVVWLRCCGLVGCG